MVFFILAALIIIVIVASIIVSYKKSNNQNNSFDSVDADLEIYQMQLKEIERDSDRGLIDKDSAEEARLEIARSILKLNKLNKKDTIHKHSWLSGGILIASILLVFIIGIGVYTKLGSPQLPQHPFYLLMEKNPNQLNEQENLARLEVLALRNPNDVKIIEELAFYYLLANRYKDAANRFNSAIALDGETAERLTGLGVAFVGDEGGIVTETAQKLFEKAIELDENQYFAQIYLAQLSLQNKRPDLALERLQKLYERLPENSSERAQLKNKIDMLSSSIDENDAEQLLQQLYNKLLEAPNHVDGWKLLIQTWFDLGNKQKALEIYTQATKLLPSAQSEELTKFVQTIGLVENNNALKDNAVGKDNTGEKPVDNMSDNKVHEDDSRGDKTDKQKAIE